ncbi:MAG: NUDIX domain-containing protein [Oscillospiraceae bacterium]|nr:NUDIX domain-containing protein [Oscillospiraceae bacterium]
MSIRSTAKAIIIKEGKVLLNECYDKMNGHYYSLPGGGQHQYETLYEALVRECLEETGYMINPVRFAALCEEICMHEGFREEYPDYAHKMYHIFICELAEEGAKIPIERDEMQVGCEWINIDSLKHLRILPKVLGDSICDVIDNTVTMFLGSEHIEFNHG